MQFLERAVELGILPEDVARPLRSGPTDVTELAERLVDEGRLTRYQVNQLLGRDTDLLSQGDYVVLECIGRGGMGTVYRARHRHLKREVALKYVHCRSSEALLRFRREMEIAAALEHPNIVQARDAGVEGDRAYLVMEYVDGPNLDELLRQRGTIAPAHALDYVVQAARGLEYAHSQKVLHRDVKPSNLLLGSNGVLKVADLGLARWRWDVARDESDDLSQHGDVFGTMAYMAPEQGVDSRTVDARADVYALGCTLYRLLTRSLPYPAKNRVDCLVQHRTAPIPSLEQIAGLPEGLDDLFRRMVAKSPDERPASMGEVAAALEKLIPKCRDPVHLDLGSGQHEGSTSGPLSSPDAPTVVFDATSPARRRAFASALIGTALLAAVVLFAVRPWEGGPEPSLPGGIGKGGTGGTGSPSGHDDEGTGEETLSEEQRRLASDLDVAKEFTNELGMTFVLVPAAPPFYMATHEVTQDQYVKVIGGNPSAFQPEGRERRVLAEAGIEQTGRHPVEYVTQSEAETFCDELGKLPAEAEAGRHYRLPTIAEWQFASTGGTNTEYFWGDEPADAEKYGWVHGNAGFRTHPIGELLPNPYGLFDIAGNVSEWTSESRLATYDVSCGGTYVDRGFRSDNIVLDHAIDGRDVGTGFRVVCDVPQPPNPAD